MRSQVNLGLKMLIDLHHWRVEGMLHWALPVPADELPQAAILIDKAKNVR